MPLCIIGDILLGIIFTGGNGPDTQFVKKILDLEVKNALFAAADSGLIAAENAGIKPDWIIGDMDSIDKSRLDVYPAECIIKYEHDKDFSDTELAFSLLHEKGCKEIWIIGGGGGRIDHLFALRSLFEREFYPYRWLTEDADIHCIDAACEINNFFGNSGKCMHVSIFPLCSGPWQAKSSALKWPLAGLSWENGFFGLSNCAPDGSYSITAEKGRFMIIEPLSVFI